MKVMTNSISQVRLSPTLKTREKKVAAQELFFVVVAVSNHIFGLCIVYHARIFNVLRMPEISKNGEKFIE